jgi:hypothetical protein
MDGWIPLWRAGRGSSFLNYQELLFHFDKQRDFGGHTLAKCETLARSLLFILLFMRIKGYPNST